MLLCFSDIQHSVYCTFNVPLHSFTVRAIPPGYTLNTEHTSNIPPLTNNALKLHRGELDFSMQSAITIIITMTGDMII